MKIKELDRTVNVAWSPANYHPILLAAGTAAQQLDASFNTTASVDLYSLNLSEPGMDLELKCSIPSQNRFHKVVWGGTGSGVVVGGCDNGKIQMYNVAKMTGGEDGLVPHQDRHTGAVKALDFNPFQANLLASGASESDIFIWDLNNTSTPMSPGAKMQPFEDVVCLAWNKQVQHILASTFPTRCTVWDLRKNEPIIKLSDSNSRVRWKVVSWHPEVATQLCLASEDDSNPVVQLWDLRFATVPLRSLQAHTRGVLSMAWCTHDADLLISSGKDNRILCWNPNSDHPTGEIQCEIANTQQWIFELSWCPRNPNLIASCSGDGHTSIYSLTGSQNQSQTTNKIADSFPGMDPLNVEQPTPTQQQTVELVKPPKWMRRPSGASFSFGGKLVSFGSGGSITVSQVSTETEFLERARQVQELVRRGQALELCKGKEDPLWIYLEATFSPSPNLSIRNLLGYPQTMKEEDVSNPIDGITNQISSLNQEDGYSVSNNIMDDQFSNPSLNGSLAFDSIANQQNEQVATKKLLTKFKIPTSAGPDGDICKALLFGDVEGAVDICLKEKRTADALVLAMAAGPQILARTQKKYFDSFTPENSVEQVIRAVVSDDWSHLVQCCELISWKEALVAVLTYAKEADLPSLCEQLGKRLEEIGGEYAKGAEICYIASGSLAALIRKRISESTNSSTKTMQELVELVMVGQAAMACQGKHIPTEGEISDLLCDYALILASQGDYQTALSYLSDAQGELAVDLTERLYANMGVKPGFTQQSSHQPQRRSSDQTQFSKMSTSAAVRSNSFLSSPPHEFPSTNQPQPPIVPPSVSLSRSAAQPPPSQSPGLSQSGGIGANKKYVVDPSVGPGGGMPRGGSQPMYSTPSNPLYQPNQSFQPTQQQPAIFQPPGSIQQPPSQFSQGGSVPFSPVISQQNSFQPGILTPSSQPPVQQQNFKNPTGPPSAQNYHSGAPGWNDPPVLSSSRPQKRADAGVLKTPITQPLYTPDPIQGMPGMPPMQPGVPPMQQGMPPMQPGMPSMTPGMPPMQQGMPPVQSNIPGVPPLQQNMTMQQGMPPMQQGMSPLQQGMPPMQQGMPPMQQGIPPMQQGMPPMQPNMSVAQSVNMSAAPLSTQPNLQPGVPPIQTYNTMQSHVPSGIPPVQQGVMSPISMTPTGRMTPAQGMPSGPNIPYNQIPPHPQVNGGGYGDPPTPRHVASQGSIKSPLPDNYKQMQECLEMLRMSCYNTSNNPQVKRKLEDVAKKFEYMYDALRDSRLSADTLTGLEQIVKLLETGDYTGALGLHTHMVSGPDFSQISSFMPALKLLIQSALQLNVYLH